MKISYWGLVETIADLVNQHCQRDDGTLNHNCLSANESAFDELEELGVLTKGEKKGCWNIDWELIEKNKQAEIGSKATEKQE